VRELSQHWPAKLWRHVGVSVPSALYFAHSPVLLSFPAGRLAEYLRTRRGNLLFLTGLPVFVNVEKEKLPKCQNAAANESAASVLLGMRFRNLLT
jgi:hypothetical protein